MNVFAQLRQKACIDRHAVQSAPRLRQRPAGAPLGSASHIAGSLCLCQPTERAACLRWRNPALLVQPTCPEPLSTQLPGPAPASHSSTHTASAKMRLHQHHRSECRLPCLSLSPAGEPAPSPNEPPLNRISSICAKCSTSRTPPPPIRPAIHTPLRSTSLPCMAARALRTCGSAVN